MDKKTEEKLSVIADRYNVMSHLLIALESGRGDWNTGNVKKQEEEGEVLGTAIYENFEEWVDVVEGKDGTLFAVEEAPGGYVGYSLPITDPKIIDIINEMRPKPKKVAKKKAQPKKKDYKGVTYMDVFKRVLDIMNDKTGYAPNDEEIEDEENGEVDICIDDDGWNHKTWSNVKAFVGGNPKESSIFDEVADLDAIYYKLADRWEAEFTENCRILGEVNVKDNSPAGIMKALDKAGL